MWEGKYREKSFYFQKWSKGHGVDFSEDNKIFGKKLVNAVKIPTTYFFHLKSKIPKNSKNSLKTKTIEFSEDDNFLLKKIGPSSYSRGIF